MPDLPTDSHTPENEHRSSADHPLPSTVDYGRLPSTGDEPPASSTSDETNTPALATVSGDRFTILRLHAQGGLGQVSLARDEKLKRSVALKEIRPDKRNNAYLRQRFLTEAEITGQLEHPGIVPIYDLDQDADGQVRYAMRFVEGRTLSDAIHDYHRQPTPLGFRELLLRFGSMCQTVAYAHSQGIIHRDLKPANVLLGDYGETLVVDWGLAKRLTTTPTGSALPNEPSAHGSVAPEQNRDNAITLTDDGPLTQEGQVLGTPAYMAPEQANGDIEGTGTPADIYSLGAILYELLTGRPPFQGRSAADVLAAVRQGRLARPAQVRPGVPRALEAICLKALARTPSERYASAGELAKEVEHWLADEPVLAWREPWRVRAGRWVRRHQPLVAGLAAGLLVLLLLGGAGAVWLGREQERQRAGAVSALERVAVLQKEARWLDARALLDQAETGLGGFGLADLRQRLNLARADLELVARLDTIRLERANLAGRTFDLTRADRKYAEAFAETGLGTEGEDVEVVAQRVAGSRVREALVAALDDWAHVARQQARHAWVLAVARQADPHPWRDRLRDPVLWRDEEKLARLVAQAQLRR